MAEPACLKRVAKPVLTAFTNLNLDFARRFGCVFVKIQALGGIVGHTQRKAKVIPARDAVQNARKCP